MNKKATSTEVTQKNRILDKAKLRFARFGYKKTTIEEICRDARVARKHIYTHFEGKEDLFTSLFIRETLRMREAGLAAGELQVDAFEKVKEMAFASIDYLERDPFLTNVLVEGEEISAPYLKEKYNTYVQDGMINIINDLLQDAIKKKRLIEFDTQLTAYALFKIFQSLTYARTIPRPSNAEGIKQEFIKIIDPMAKHFSMRNSAT